MARFPRRGLLRELCGPVGFSDADVIAGRAFRAACVTIRDHERCFCQDKLIAELLELYKRRVEAPFGFETNFAICIGNFF